MQILAIVLGCFVGLSFSLLITTKRISKSNDFGNDKGEFNHFAESGLHIIEERDNIKRPKF